MTVYVSAGEVATIVTIDRPRFNTLTIETVERLEQTFRQHSPDRPLILTGEGSVFSAGVDVQAYISYSRSERRALAAAITRMCAAMLAMPSPTIAAISGHAIGGGLVLTLLCDYRIAVNTDDAKFGLGEAKAGVPFPAGLEAVIRHEIPSALLRQLALSSKNVTGQELLAHAVFDELVPGARLLERAVDMAKDLHGQPAFRPVKQQIRGELSTEVGGLAQSGAESHF